MLKPRILMSYAYLSEAKLDALLPFKDDFIFLIDSGAYTAWTRRKEVDLSDYLSFINLIVEKGFNLEAYLMLDIINDHARTLENYNIMREAGFTPMPIFTRGAPRENLELFYEHTDYVAIGGVFAGSMAEHQYMKAIMQDWVQGRKVHWLGYAKKEMLLHFRPHSFDTSSFASSVRFGNISLFMNGSEVRIKRDGVKSWIGQAGVRSWIARYGLDPDRFRHNESWKNDGTYSEETCILGHLSILSYCEYYYNLEKRDITRPYLAVTDEWQAKEVVNCYNKILKLKGGQ